MALWKVYFEKTVREKKVTGTLFVEVQIYAEDEEEAISRAKERVAEYFDVEGCSVTTYMYRKTLDAWVPGLSAHKRWLEELTRRGVELKLTEEGQKLIEERDGSECSTGNH